MLIAAAAYPCGVPPQQGPQPPTVAQTSVSAGVGVPAVVTITGGAANQSTLLIATWETQVVQNEPCSALGQPNVQVSGADLTVTFPVIVQPLANCELGFQYGNSAYTDVNVNFPGVP